MHPLSVSSLAMASVTAYVGLYHLMIYLRRRLHREDLTFALICLGVAVYDVFAAGLYSATSVSQGVQWQRAQVVALALIATAFLWFAADYTRQLSRKACAAFSTYFLLAAVIQIVNPEGWVWRVGEPSVKRLALSSGFEITYYEATPGPFTNLQSVLGLAAGIYILWGGVRLYRSGNRRQAVPLLVALGLFFAAAVNDTAVSIGLHRFPYVMEYAYLGIVLLVTYHLSSRVIETALVKESLQESEEWFRSTFEQAAVGIAHVALDGRFLRINQRFCDIVGCTREEMLSRTLQEITHPDDLDADLDYVQRALGAKNHAYMEKRYMRSDGSFVWVNLTASLLRGQDGQPKCFIFVVEDITGRKQTEETLAERTRALQALYEVALAVGVELEMPRLLHRVLERATRLLSADQGGAIYLHQPEEGGLRLVVGYALNEAYVGATLAPGEGLAGTVFQTRQPLFQDDYRNWEGRSPIFEDAGFTAVLAVPLLWREQVIGVLSLNANRQKRTFGPSDVQLAQMFAALAAVAIENARLFESEREHRALAEALRDTAAALNSTLNLDEVLERVLASVGRVVPHDAANIMFVDGGTAYVVRERGYAGKEVDAERLRFRVDETATLRHMAETHEPIVIPDISVFAAWVDVPEEHWIRSYAGAPIYIRSYAGAPMCVEEELIGFLSLDSTISNAFKRFHASRLKAFADQAAVAIANARLYQELQAVRGMLEQTVETRTAELRRTKERTEVILSNSPVAILFLRSDGAIETGNQAFWSLFGYDFDEVLGQPLSALVEPSFHEALSSAVYAALHRGQASRLEVVALRKDGAVFDASIAIAGIQEVGLATGLVCSIQDISVLKEVSRMKDAFVSNVSHELRTPIASLKLYHDLLARNPEKQETYMVPLRRETDRLATIVEDLLTLSRLDQDRVSLRCVPLDLDKLAGQYVSDRTPLAESRGQRLLFTSRGKLPAVWADRSLLGQALSVILTNALNYTPTGGQVVVSTSARDLEGKSWVGVVVSDTGPGIPPEEQPRLFERFFRGSAAREANTPGTGLGLAIAKEIIDRHNGRIEVTSAGVPGKGATFSIWLPAVENV